MASWTHPSVQKLMRESRVEDPVAEVVRRARELTLEALEEGWDGPPFDPFELAELRGVEIVARDNVDDARLVEGEGGRPRIEFNPNRRPARVRFSIAHELGHLLFDDHAERARYRDRIHADQVRSDDWQLELLCNRAAAELLMPAGAFPQRLADDLSLPHLLDLRAEFGVSTEALLNRVVRLTDRPAALFAAARSPAAGGGFRVDYVVPARGWHPKIATGSQLDAGSVLARCSAVGFADSARETWDPLDGELDVQVVGIPPYPGDHFPRVVGLIRPAVAPAEAGATLRYARGDVTRPMTTDRCIIAHVVNDKARRWGGRGVATALGRRFKAAGDAYALWPSRERKLGALHITESGEENVWIASLVAQSGYGESVRPRLRLPALRITLARLAVEAASLDAPVHIPLIGTGQGRTPWPTVRDLVMEEVCGSGTDVVVYVRPQDPMPPDALPRGEQHQQEQLTVM